MRDAASLGLFPMPRLNLPDCQRPPSAGTFRWVKRSHDLPSICGTVYTDASRIDSGHPDTMRLGWAFVVVDANQNIVDVASGTPPTYIDNIPRGEAWDLVQASTFASASSTFISDCRPCVDAVHWGEGANKGGRQMTGSALQTRRGAGDGRFI